MFNALLAGVLLALYAAYLFTGISQGFPIAWLDWHAPYFHYELNREASLQVFILPVVLGLLTAFNWYRSSMRNEA
ncbi:MAG: hypothetical protein H7A35_12150 [Planctomycetales bacterium]|nr:hypothetical protein [bacterium]UNM07607.1 MAG: hypothetical protein H7A35_12150 [Planctomycetales bacterium]